jgi:hypothetical protein
VRDSRSSATISWFRWTYRVPRKEGMGKVGSGVIDGRAVLVGEGVLDGMAVRGGAGNAVVGATVGGMVELMGGAAVVVASFTEGAGLGVAGDTVQADSSRRKAISVASMRISAAPMARNVQLGDARPLDVLGPQGGVRAATRLNTSIGQYSTTSAAMLTRRGTG